MNGNQLEQFIYNNQIQASIIDPGVPVPTVVDAARAMNVEPTRILKSLVFLSNADEMVLAIAAGIRRIDTERLEQVTGYCGIRLADRRAALECTGFPVGAMPPIGHESRSLTVVVDTQVMEMDQVFGGGGTVETLLQIAPEEICRATNAIVANISEPD